MSTPVTSLHVSRMEYSMSNTSYSVWSFHNDLPLGNNTRSVDAHTTSDIKRPVKIVACMHGHMRLIFTVHYNRSTAK